MAAVCRLKLLCFILILYFVKGEHEKGITLYPLKFIEIKVFLQTTIYLFKKYQQYLHEYSNRYKNEELEWPN